jgi:hypothetical protein
MAKTKLPAWLSITDKGVFRVDRDAAYGEVMAGIGFDLAKLDQYTAEVVYQCTKMEVQRIVREAGVDPRPLKAMIIDIAVPEGGKDRFALSALPRGRGAEAASQGREAREHYRRWRGFVPD